MVMSLFCIKSGGFKYNNLWVMVLLVFLLSLTCFYWWRDISREGAYQGHHTSDVYSGLKISMLLFISSEVMFFFSFFWAFFHFALSPELEVGNSWPPAGVILVNPYHIPLLNTVILLSSGVTVTLAHHALLNFNYLRMKMSLFFTIMLGVIFTFFQVWEYVWMPFSLYDSNFGSIFFLATGFHGFHVFVGTLFLLVNYIRLILSLFNQNHHFSFEGAAWYWHFVDVVWIFLYIFVYWWFY
uniref:Cytochrome c oxidase subunit 3 n=1 Tax=Amblyseius obtuserellus TaxID=3061186 RepID=A0AAU6PD85_9ACAR